MNVLDENIPDSQRQLLRGWRIPIRQIGHEIGSSGMRDEEIISLLHRHRSVTFFTRDLGFYNPKFCHPNYCLTCLAVDQYETASFIRRFLKHLSLNTKIKRMGKIIRISHKEIRIWQRGGAREETLKWV